MTKNEVQNLVNQSVRKSLVQDLGREAEAKQYYLERCEGAFNLLEEIRHKIGNMVEFPMDDMNRLELEGIMKKLEFLDFDFDSEDCRVLH